ncbi:GAF domain-containing sensor histidine kinase [Qingshengfaniella alkalisoli]|uniref:GAF domain-containing sensor histidine kinase n=1 Tax=Qingshengfaniella alkalisoli TaxID=2599296 RepID=A0A5B8IAZ6_9RHOB|nr:GAF domain-containing sensor histidine kinase [Qingshengfaniella alkalisoli]QDY70526.1 GAF domain-containing sensor histidine kinase [Qingshengfaniella alkalisoli]
MGLVITETELPEGTLAAHPRFRDDDEGLHASRLQRIGAVGLEEAERSGLTARLDRALRVAGASWGALVLGSGRASQLTIRGPAPDSMRRLLTDLRSSLGNFAPEVVRKRALASGDKLVVAPLLSIEAQVGALIIAIPRAAGSTENAAELAELAADDLVGFLDVASHARQIAHIRGHLSLIHQLGQQMTTIHDRSLLFREITRLIRQSLGYEHIQLLLTDDDTSRVELAHADGPYAEKLAVAGCSATLGHGIIGRVAQSGRLWNSPDVRSDAHFAPNSLLPDTRSELALPLRLGQRVIGVLDIQSDIYSAFPREDVVLLQTIADQIAPAIEQHRLFAAERRERELSDTLADVSRIISSKLEQDHVLGAVLRELRRVVPYRGSRVTLQGEDGLMRAVAAVGFPDNARVMSHSFAPNSAPLSRPVIEQHETLVIQDVRREKQWSWHPGTEQIVSWLAVPLVHGRDCVGWLCVDWPEPDFFTADHARILRAFSEQAVVAIENARLFERARHLSSGLEREVAQRTRQLELAHQDISAKAEELRLLCRRLVQIQESERQRIAYELHDSVAQSILAATYQLQSIRRRVGEDPKLEQRILECQKTLDDSHHEMKQIIYALRPTLLDEMGLVAALDNHTSAIRRHVGIDLSFDVRGTPVTLAPEVELAIYRIVQEACQNCVRHSGAAHLGVAIDFNNNELQVSVADDGRGFVEDTDEPGLGLVGMRERSRSVGGELILETRPGRGTKIVFTLSPESTAA